MRELESKAAIVVVTSDKCYRNPESGQHFREEDALGGHDVYSMSKAAAELVVASWHSSFFSTNKSLGPLATARGGNALGGGDYAADRLLPDAVRAFVAQAPLVLRCPHAVRPWQHVLDLLSGYLALGQRLLSHPTRSRLLSYNFAPDFGSERSVQQVVDAWLSHWPGPLHVQAAAQPAYAEAACLSLDPSRAMNELGWRPVWDFATSVQQTAQWYWQRHGANISGTGMRQLTQEQIQKYTMDARVRLGRLNRTLRLKLSTAVSCGSSDLRPVIDSACSRAGQQPLNQRTSTSQSPGFRSPSWSAARAR